MRIKTESLRKYFPRNYSAQQMEREILKLLETRYRTRNRGERCDFVHWCYTDRSCKIAAGGVSHERKITGTLTEDYLPEWNLL